MADQSDRALLPNRTPDDNPSPPIFDGGTPEDRQQILDLYYQFLRANDALDIEVDLPSGATGRLDPPATPSSAVTVDGERWEPGGDLPPGHHAIRIRLPRVARS